MLFTVCLYITMHKTNAKRGKSIKIYRENTLRLCIFMKITTFEATFTTLAHDFQKNFCDFATTFLRLSATTITTIEAIHTSHLEPPKFRFSRFTVRKRTDIASGRIRR